MVRKASVAFAAALMIGAKPVPDGIPVGWTDASERGACGLRRGPFGIGHNGGEFIFVVASPGLSKTRFRSIEIDGKSYGAQFVYSKEGGGAIMSPAMVRALSVGKTVSVDWPEFRATETLEMATEAMVSVLDCGAALAEKARKRAEGAQRMMAFGAALRGAGAALNSGAEPAPATPGGGMSCPLQSQAASGFYRNCAYRCITGTVVRTVGAAELCPITLN